MNVKSRSGLGTIVVALIWAMVIFAVATVLGDAQQSSRVLSILGGGAAASIIVSGGLRAQERKTQ